MSDGVIVAIITSASSLILALVNLVVAAVRNKRERKSGLKDTLSKIFGTLETLASETKQQQLAILRLTVMDKAMPMSERLTAGREYMELGGNGDVKAYFKKLEKEVNSGKGS